MSLRIGAFVFTPNTLMLPLALAFFVVLAFQGLYPRVVTTRLRAYGVLLAAIAGGVVGGWLYGWAASPAEVDELHAWLDLRFGSFGGYWGALAAGMAGAWVARQRALECADALVPGILAGGAVARVGCLFTGCCRGITVPPELFHGLQPFRPWPAYDLAALLAVLAVVRIAPRRVPWLRFPGAALCLFLVLYGALRFPLEFLRDLPAAAGPLTSGQVLAWAQLLAGIAGVAWLARRDRSDHRTSPP